MYVVGQDKLTNRIANSFLLLSACHQWYRSSADTVPAHQSVGHWVRAQNYRYRHLRYEEVSIRKRSTRTHGKRERAPERSRRKGRGRTSIFAFAVSFLSFLLAINQPKGMLQLKEKQLVNTLGPFEPKKKKKREQRTI